MKIYSSQPWSSNIKNNNTKVLALCQALYTSSLSIDLTLTGIVGYSLAKNKEYATLPFALITVAAAITTIFAALSMKKFGRRCGFMIGALAAGIGGIISISALFNHSFVTFCFGTACVGVFQAYAQYYRLAAADSVGKEHKGNAIATVLTGGVIAAIVGPFLASWGRDLIPFILFSGAYAIVAVFGFLTLFLIYFYFNDQGGVESASPLVAMEEPRPLKEIIKQSRFIAALANNSVGYAVMMFIMTATPIAAIGCGHTLNDGAHIIQWHMVGMYAPSLFSSRLIKRFGEVKIVLFGIFLLSMSALIAMQSSTLPYFYGSLACLGIGWNLMFVGGSTILAKSYSISDSHKAQAFSEFFTFGFSAIGSLSAGLLLVYFDWKTINSFTLPLLGLVAGITFWHMKVERKIRN